MAATTTPPTRRSGAPTWSGPRRPPSRTPAAGAVTGTEVEDEESYYEVEVTLDDGTQVDVQLDESFAVVGDKVDDEGDDD